MAEAKTGEKKEKEEKIIRIMSHDVRGGMSVHSGLTKIKGVSWGMSNAACRKTGTDKRRKIESLSEKEIKKISDFMKNPDVPDHLKNRRFDPETGENRHLTGTDLELRKSFDVKKLKQTKSYRGVRHAAGLPLRGQRTKGNFRKNRAKGTGIKKKNKKQ